MRSQRPRKFFAALSFVLVLCSGEACAGETDEFDRKLAQITGDWVAEDWHFGKLRLHHQDFIPEADQFFLHLWEEERPRNKTAQEFLEQSFSGAKIGDYAAEREVPMTDTVKIGDNILIKPTEWRSQFGLYTTFWGVVTTRSGGFIPFKSQCNFRPHRSVTYTGERCVQTVDALLRAIQDGTLPLPRTPAPVAIAQWSGSMRDDGIVAMFYTGWFGGFGANPSPARSSHIFVGPARRLAPENERAAIVNFADKTLVSGFGAPTPTVWNGPVLSRTQPEAGEGPAIQLAMAATIPDGRKSLVSLSCWNTSWQEVCMGALARVVEDLETGFTQEKWQARIPE